MKDIELARKSITVITKILSGRGVNVTQIGSDAFVMSDLETGEVISINIPYIPDDASEELIYAINGFLDHEVAHVLFTDFKLAKEIEQPHLLKGIFNVLEDMRIENLMASKFPGSKSNLLNVGRFVIDKKIHLMYEELMNKSETNEIAFFECLFAPIFRSYGQEIFATYMSDKWDKVKSIKDRLASVESEIGKSKSTKDVVELAKKIFALFEKGEEQKERDEEQNEGKDKKDEDKNEGKKEKCRSDTSAEDKRNSEKNDSQDNDFDDSDDGDLNDSDDSDEGDSDDSDSEENESGENGDKSDDENADEKSDSSESDSSESDSSESDFEDDSDYSDDGEIEDELEPHSKSIECGLDFDSLQPKDFSKAMAEAIASDVISVLINSEYKVLTKDFDLIEKMDYEKEIDNAIKWGKVGESKKRKSDIYKKDKEVIENVVDGLVLSMENETRRISGVLQKTLERLMKAKTKSRNLPGKKSGRVNPSSLFRLKTGDERVFRQKDIGESNDVAISLVVDCSGSMSGDKIKLAMESAFALCDVLSKIGVKNEVLGFTTLRMDAELMRNAENYSIGVSTITEKAFRFSRLEPLWLPIFKSFDERFLPINKRKMALMTDCRYAELRNNVDGESIMLAAKRLMAQKEKGKQMIVLSDGAPVAYGVVDDLRHDLAKSVKEIEKMGINIMGIGIMDSSVEDFYKNNIVISELENLPIAILEKIKDILV